MVKLGRGFNPPGTRWLAVTLTFYEELLGGWPGDPEVARKFVLSRRPDGVSPDEVAASEDDAEANADLEESCGAGGASPDEIAASERAAKANADLADVRNAMTVFPRMPDGRPCIFSYMVKGFFKGAASNLNRLAGKTILSTKLKAYKKIVDGCIFVYPALEVESPDIRRMIPLLLPDGKGIERIAQPIRPSDDLPPGEKVTLPLCQRPLRAQTAKGERVSLAMSEAAPVGTKISFVVKVLPVAEIKLVDTLLEWFSYGEDWGIGQWRNSGKGQFAYESIQLEVE